MTLGPAYRIETERLVLRCFELHDARAWNALLAHEGPRLSRSLAWAREEPRPLAAHVELVRAFRSRFDADEEWAYALVERETGALVGSLALRPIRDEPDAASLGYWLAAAAEGRGLAFEACGALVRAAFEIQGCARLEIHCDASNARSRALAERLGFRLDAELRARGHTPGEARAVHSLFAAEFAAAPAAGVAARAFDALDEPLPAAAPPRRAGFR
ncbi:MAG: GNAT family N-acetyltransferase [Planctomycetes bacterium]|nr:GNAT family N-acetyltransferase [Planctomycetota bacterium]